jgi:hypothetical protein
MPDEIEGAIGWAEGDPEIKVIVLRAALAGRSPADTTSAMAS